MKVAMRPSWEPVFQTDAERIDFYMAMAQRLAEREALRNMKKVVNDYPTPDAR